MLELLRDPIWQSIAVIIPLLGVLLRYRKKIFFSMSSLTRIIAKRNFPKSRLFISFLLLSCLLLLPFIGFAFNTTKPLPPPYSELTDHPIDTGDIFFDDFNTDKGIWSLGNSISDWGNIDRLIKNGKYILDIKSLDAIFLAEHPTGGIHTPANFTFVTDFRQVSTPGETSYGLFFLAQNDCYYFFKIRDQGRFHITKIINGESITVTDWKETTVITPNGTNTLSVVAKSTNIKFFINRTLVEEINNNDLLDGGGIGIGISMDKNQSALIEVDNLKVSME